MPLLLRRATLLPARVLVAQVGRCIAVAIRSATINTRAISKAQHTRLGPLASA